MTVLARDAVASDHLVYAWPFPIGPECEVACAEDEQVVMCPAWMVGDRLGPGRHRWRTPDPSRPVGAFFVLTAPVEVSFDMVTSFLIPATGQPVRLRASGSLQVRCADPGLLIAQFVGLPFDHVNEGVLRSVSRSVERMLARLLTRRAVMAGTPLAVTDANMLPSIVEELVAYHPTAGAVFGVELMRMGHLVVVADDGSTPYLALPSASGSWPGAGNGHVQQPVVHATSGPKYKRPVTPVLETIRGMPAVTPDPDPTDVDQPSLGQRGAAAAPTASGEVVPRHSTPPPTVVSGEIVPRTTSVPPTATTSSSGPVVSGEIAPRHKTPPPGALSAVSGEITPRHSTSPKAGVASGEITPAPTLPAQPRQKATLPPPLPSLTKPRAAKAEPPPPEPATARAPTQPADAILGIGMGAIGATPVHTPPPPAAPPPAASAGGVAPGQRVLVPGPNGLMQSATVRQLLQGYYELEVGSSGQTIWVPMGGVVPEP